MGSHKRQSSYIHKQDEWKQLYEAGMSFTQIGKTEGIHYKTVQTVLNGIVEPRPKQQYAHLVKEWIELYTVNEMSITAIAEQYKTNSTTVSKYLKNEGVELRRQYGQPSPYEPYFSKWIQNYENGKTLKEIADEHGTFPQTIHKHIKDKVKMREYTETSAQYDLDNPNYFSVLDSHEKAYWLGAFYASGFSSKSIGGFEVSLVVGIKDKLLLERFRDVIGYEKDIEEMRKDNMHTAKLRIHNKTFYENLAEIGFSEKKHEITCFPKGLRSEFYNSFLLGYYEGKGSCYTVGNKIRGGTYYQTPLFLFGNETLLASFKNIIYKETGVNMNTGVSVPTAANKSEVHRLAASAKDKVEKIADWLYRDCNTYLEHRDIREILKSHKVQAHKLKRADSSRN